MCETDMTVNSMMPPNFVSVGQVLTIPLWVQHSTAVNHVHPSNPFAKLHY